MSTRTKTRKKARAKTDAASVIVALAKTAVHALNVYSDDDPDGQEVMHGLTKLAETIHTLCGLDGSELEGYYTAIKDATDPEPPYDTLLVTAEEMRETEALLRETIERLEPEELDADRLKAAVEYFSDFWEVMNDGK